MTVYPKHFALMPNDLSMLSVVLMWIVAASTLGFSEIAHFTQTQSGTFGKASLPSALFLYASTTERQPWCHGESKKLCIWSFSGIMTVYPQRFSLILNDLKVLSVILVCIGATSTLGFSGIAHYIPNTIRYARQSLTPQRAIFVCGDIRGSALVPWRKQKIFLAKYYIVQECWV